MVSMVSIYTITNTCFTSASLRYAIFNGALFLSSPKCPGHNGENTRKLSVLCTGHGRAACELKSFFGTDCLYLYGVDILSHIVALN